MRKTGIAVILLLSISLVFTLACGSSSTSKPTGATVTPSTVVTFPDSKLEAAIREAIKKSSGNIYQSDLDGLTSLDATLSNITNLSGLEHCTNLWELYLGGNQISDISPLSGLRKLEELYLHKNNISDISALSKLTNLQVLTLSDNQIRNISTLSGLTNLETLYLSDNQISNISPLSGLTNLETLYLDDNNRSDISALSGLTNLYELWLEGNRISNISPLSGLTNLEALYLDDNNISDISALVTNSGLGDDIADRVYLNCNPLSTTSIKTYIPKLRSRGVGVFYTDTCKASQ